MRCHLPTFVLPTATKYRLFRRVPAVDRAAACGVQPKTQKPPGARGTLPRDISLLRGSRSWRRAPPVSRLPLDPRKQGLLRAIAHIPRRARVRDALTRGDSTISATTRRSPLQVVFPLAHGGEQNASHSAPWSKAVTSKNDPTASAPCFRPDHDWIDDCDHVKGNWGSHQGGRESRRAAGRPPLNSRAQITSVARQ